MANVCSCSWTLLIRKIIYKIKSSHETFPIQGSPNNLPRPDLESLLAFLFHKEEFTFCTNNVKKHTYNRSLSFQYLKPFNIIRNRDYQSIIFFKVTSFFRINSIHWIKFIKYLGLSVLLDPCLNWKKYADLEHNRLKLFVRQKQLFPIYKCDHLETSSGILLYKS